MENFSDNENDKDEKNLYTTLYGDKIPLMLNLGGSKPHPYWQHLPKSFFFKKNEIVLPADDNSVEAIYISDLLEMMPNGAIVSLFDECMRVLKRYGHLRISVRNIMLFFYAMKNRDIFMFNHVKDFEKYSINQLFINEFASQKSQVNTKEYFNDASFDKMIFDYGVFYALDYVTNETINIEHQEMSDRINWFNLKKIEDIFTGRYQVKTVFYSYYGQSNVPIMRNTNYFDNYLPEKSIFIEIRKPYDNVIINKGQ